jgi:hypothetical protein
MERIRRDDSGRRFIEDTRAWPDPLYMNAYLKIVILILAVALVLYFLHMTISNDMMPWVRNFLRELLRWLR